MIWKDNDTPPVPPSTEPTEHYVFEESAAPYLEGSTIPATKPHPGMDPANGRIRFQDEYLDTYVSGPGKDEGESYTVESATCAKDAPKVPKTYELTKTTYEAKRKRQGTTNYYQKGWLVTLEVTVTEWKH